ncbi:hypothetical protein H7Y63_02235 [Polaromonas sp.]|nr:hypothetical protein [Candidatus Saccharibacteria bacterium]
MKQKDIALIIAVAGISTILAFFLGNTLFGGTKNRQTKINVVDSISSNFPTADTRYFNSKAINPTQSVQIGTNNNPKPFNQ